jgi:hypothetical protein
MLSTFVSISASDIASTTAYAGGLFSDLWPIIAIFLGISIVAIILKIFF